MTQTKSVSISSRSAPAFDNRSETDEKLTRSNFFPSPAMLQERAEIKKKEENVSLQQPRTNHSPRILFASSDEYTPKLVKTEREFVIASSDNKNV
jgi:hypothetical protein